MDTNADILSRYRVLGKRSGADDVARSVTVQALTEVIVENRGDNKNEPPSPTEYFSAIMTALQGPISPQHVALMFLLSVVMVGLPTPVMRLKGEESFEIVMTILKRENDKGDQDDHRLIRYCLTVMGLILAAQEPSNKRTWDRPLFSHGFHLLLSCIGDARPKIRKVAQQGLGLILDGHVGCTAPAKGLAQFSIKVCNNASISNVQEVSRFLSFLHQNTGSIGASMPSQNVLKLCVQMFDLVRLGNVHLASNAFRFVEALCPRIPENKRETVESKVKLLENIVIELNKTMMNDPKKSKFITSDKKLSVAYINCIEKAERVLFGFSSENGTMSSKLPDVLEVLLVCIANIDDNKTQLTIPVGTICTLMKYEHDIRNLPDTMTQVLEQIEVLLGPQYENTWTISLEILRSYFLELADYESRNQVVANKENSWIEKLAQVRQSVINPVTGSDKPNLTIQWRPSLERVIGAAISSLGVERVLDTLSLEDGQSGVAPIRAWLIPVLRQYIGSGKAPTSLAYFRSSILGTAAQCERLAMDPSIGPNGAKLHQMKCIQLWSLLPPFCKKAEDVAAPAGLQMLAPVLAQALEEQRYPELVEYVCHGLRNLIRAATNGQGQEEEGGATGNEEDKEVLANLGKQILPILFNLYNELTLANANERANFVHELIQRYATIVSPHLINNMFRQLVQQLIVAQNKTTNAKNAPTKKGSAKTEMDTGDGSDSDDDDDDDEDNDNDEKNDSDDEEKVGKLQGPDEELDEEKQKIYVLSSLSLALIPVLDKQSVDLLYRVILPFIEDEDDGILQKRGYQVLECICNYQIEWVLGKRQELQEFLQNAFYAVSINAKTARLRCLSHLFKAYGSSASDISCEAVNEVTGNIMGEVVLATKEHNKKARTAAFKLLVDIGDMLEQVHLKRQNNGAAGIRQYLQMIVAGLAARTPHMKAAAIGALSRAIGAYHDRQASGEDFVEAARTGLLLLSEKSREIAKACIGLAKVCAIRLYVDDLKQLLPDLLKALLPWANDTKNQFSTKIRIIFERLCKRIGPDTIVETGVIDNDHKILAYIRKQANYKRRRYERKRNGEIVGGGVKPQPKKKQDDDSSSDDEDDLDDRPSGRRKGKDTVGLDEDVVMDEKGGEAIDLLGSNALGRVQRVSASRKNNDAKKDQDQFKFAKDGRILIPDDGQDDDEDDDDDDMDIDGSKTRGRKRRYGSDDEEMEDNFGSNNRKQHQQQAAEKKRVTGQGQEYRATKAGGDQKKKGSKFEPFAYIPLDARMLNKRRKHDAARQFKGLTGKRAKDGETRGGKGKKGNRRK